MADAENAPRLNRRELLAGAVGVAAFGAGARRAAAADAGQWSPEYIQSIAGTEQIDTAAECAKVVPLNTKGRLTYWYVGPNDATPDIEKQTEAQFWAAWAKTYPNITVERQNLDYNQMLNKLRTAALGNAAPMVAKMPILWGVEFAAKGQLRPFKPEDAGYSSDDYWPGAMKSVTYRGSVFGIPTNNETMALIWNAHLFEAAGLDPEKPPPSWDDLVLYAKQIKDRTGKNGYGLVARVNAGNTPFRFMPQLWAYGGGALDEAEANPSYQKIMINNAGSRAALQAAVDMYVRDHSAPVSALTNTQTENEDPFIAGQLGMMIGHPSEYAVMLDRARKATGDDKTVADRVVEGIRYGLVPTGPARRAIVFGGSNLHVFDPKVIDGGRLDEDAVRAFAAFSTGPEWSGRLLWASSNPSHRRGFRTIWMKERLQQTKFLNVTTSMLPSGIPFPVIPESGEIMNIVVPEMMQNALTRKMTVAAATDDAARKIKGLLSGL